MPEVIQTSYEIDRARYVETYPEFLGSAYEYLDAPTHERFEYVKEDARTALFEALTSHGHLSTTDSHWDESIGGFVANGKPIRDVLKSGLTRFIQPEERVRRQAELDEENLIESMFLNGEFKRRALLTISPYPDNMDQNMAGDLGYRPMNRKYMLRWVEVDAEGKRRTDQLSMSGSNVGVINELYRRLGYLDPGSGLDSTEVLASPILIDKREIDGVEDIAGLLDELAGGNRAFGEPSSQPADYQNLRRRSALAERSLQNFVSSFANDMIGIAQFSRSHSQARRQYAEILKQTMVAVCFERPEYCRDALGEASVRNITKARQLYSAGRSAEAETMLARAYDQAHDIFMCGMRISQSESESGEKSAANSKTMSCVTCPFCKKTVDAIETPEKIKCPKCAAEVRKK